MQATVSTKRIGVERIGIAMLVLVVIVIGVVGGSREMGVAEPHALGTAPDLTGLALDRDGADVAGSLGRRAVDATGLRLDRDGADLIVVASTAADVTALTLDRDGADVVPD